MKRTGKRLLLGFMAASTLAVGYLLFRPRAVVVDTAEVIRGPLRVTIDEEGETRVRDRYLVTAPVAGQLSRIELRQGDSVQPGTVVANLVPLPMDARARQAAEARVSQAEDAERAARARVASARAALAQARRSRERAEELAGQKAMAPAELEQAQLDEVTRTRELESADFQLQAAGHEVQAARSALVAERGGTIPLRSPVCGQLLRLPEASARVVAAGEPLFELGDCGQLEVVADLLSSDAIQVSPGATMLIDGWGGTDTLRARLRRIEPSAVTKVSALGVEEQRVNVVGDLLETPPTLGDRFRVQVHIVLWESPDVLMIPASALYRDGDGWSVFVIRMGTARTQAVQVGHRGASEVEVLSGLAQGEVILRNPTDQITDGVRVRSR